MTKTIEKSECGYCGLANPSWAHRGSLRCRYLHDQRKMRNLGLVQVSINCQPLLIRLGIPYDVAIGNYHVGSRGCKGFTTSACFVAPSVKAALTTQGRKQRDHAVRIAAGLPSVAPRSIRYLHPKLPKPPHTPEYQPGAGISEAMALHNNCCKDGSAGVQIDTLGGAL